MTDNFRLSDANLKIVIDNLDETGGSLIKESELRYWIEYFVNSDRRNATQQPDTPAPRCNNCNALETECHCCHGEARRERDQLDHKKHCPCEYPYLGIPGCPRCNPSKLVPAAIDKDKP